jgi:predicted dehydrogenase
MLRVGVVGVGHLGRHHARVYSALPSCELAGVYDVDAGRARAVADEFGTRATDGLSELIERADAVSIAVPTTAHREVALACLEAGVHVLIEKPIASDLEEAEAIVSAASRRGLVVQVGHVERFNPAIRAALAVLSEPRFIEAHRLGIFVPRGTDVAVVLDLMIHDIDLILSAVGSEVAWIDAVGIPVLSPSIDIANARIRFEDGCVANVTASRVSREKVRKIRFFQADAYITVDCLAPAVEVFRRRDVPEQTLWAIASGEIPGGLTDVVDHETLTLDEGEPLRLELESFVDAVTTGSRPVVSGEDGLKALKVVLEILDQMGRGGPGGPAPPARA